MMTYTMDIAGLKRDLPLCPVSDDLYIGAFVMFGDVEMTIHAPKELLKRAPEFDYIIAPEAKAIPLAYEMSRQCGIPYLLARKKAKAYMTGIFEVHVHSITTGGTQTLIIDTADAERMNGKRILIAAKIRQGSPSRVQRLLFGLRNIPHIAFLFIPPDIQVWGNQLIRSDMIGMQSGLSRTDTL